MVLLMNSMPWHCNTPINKDFDSFYTTSSSYQEIRLLSKGSGRIELGSADLNVSVHDCLFRQCSSNGNGGALYYSSNYCALKLLVEDSTFISCTTTSTSGGAIYISHVSNSGNSFLNKICFFNCSASLTSRSDGQCFYINTNGDIYSNNFVSDVSICNSINTNSNSRHAFNIQNGNILLTRNNITKNECFDCSACFSSTTLYSASFIYSSFVNNTASGYGCMQLDTPHEIKACNFLGNEQNSKNSPSLLYANGNVYISRSCILENNKDKTLFCVGNAECVITLENCTIDRDYESTSWYNQNIVIRDTNTRAFINGLVHLNRDKCKSSFDSVGTLTVDLGERSKGVGLCVTYVKKSSGSFNILDLMKYTFLNTIVPLDK